MKLAGIDTNIVHFAPEWYFRQGGLMRFRDGAWEWGRRERKRVGYRLARAINGRSEET